MKRRVSILLKILGALCIGGLVALAFLQRDPWITTRVERMLSDSMTQILGVPFRMKLASLDLIGGRISLENVSAVSATSSWEVRAPRVDMNISWLSALRHRACALDIVLYEPRVQSGYENKKLALVDPFLALVYAPTELPVFLRSCTFHNGLVLGITQQLKITGSCSGSTVIQPRIISTKIVVDDGDVLRDNIHLAGAIAGSIEIDTDTGSLANSITTHLSADVLTSSGFMRSTVFGAYKDSDGSWTWYPADRSLMITAEKVSFDAAPRAHVRAQGALSAFAPYVPVSFLPVLSGAASISADVELVDEDFRYSASAELTGVGYAGWNMQHGQLVFQGNLHRATGTVALGQDAQSPLIAGGWSYDVDQLRFDTDLRLKKQLEVAEVGLDKEVSEGTLSYANGKLHARYALGLIYPSKERASIKGTITSDQKEARITGMWGSAPYDLVLQLDPFMIRAGKSMYAKGAARGKKRFELTDTAQGVKATIDFDFLKEIARTLKLDAGYSVSGQAQVVTHASVSPLGRPKISLEITKGTIKIPTKHNVLQSLTGTFEYDSLKRRLLVSDLSIGLYKGTLSATSAYFEFTPAGKLSYAYVPLTCHNVFISPNKGFVGNFSGYIVAHYVKGRWLCQGSLTLDKAQLRSNLLSSQVQRDLLSATSEWTKNIDLALQLHTRSPLIVKTPFFQAHAHIKGMVSGTAAKPAVAATIELSDGSFAFPYRPLYIMAGKLFLSPSQPNDPIIELTAKNTIKKYTITMHVTGTVHQPKISFDSSPHVSEESILTLLVSGSDGPLASAMPNIIMSQVENVLFGSDEKLTKAQQFFKGLLKPLKNVRLLPTMSEPGKGIKGAIEVDINDRLRAKAQNSLDLSDETQLEVEYLLSDDMTVKAVRDDKGALGGELEMRWKF